MPAGYSKFLLFMVPPRPPVLSAHICRLIIMHAYLTGFWSGVFAREWYRLSSTGGHDKPQPT